jgi:hypothetical protein
MRTKTLLAEVFYFLPGNSARKLVDGTVIKRTQKKAIKQQTQILAEICQNRIADKGQIFEGFFVAQIKKF